MGNYLVEKTVDLTAVSLAVSLAGLWGVQTVDEWVLHWADSSVDGLVPRLAALLVARWVGGSVDCSVYRRVVLLVD